MANTPHIVDNDRWAELERKFPRTESLPRVDASSSDDLLLITMFRSANPLAKWATAAQDAYEALMREPYAPVVRLEAARNGFIAVIQRHAMAANTVNDRSPAWWAHKLAEFRAILQMLGAFAAETQRRDAMSLSARQEDWGADRSDYQRQKYLSDTARDLQLGQSRLDALAGKAAA